jgi:peptide/nickel transport system permease protein
MTTIVPPATSAVQSAISKSRVSGAPNAFVRFLRRPLGVAAAVFLAIACVAWVAPWLLTTADPQISDFASVLITPTWEHPLGTDAVGRDIYARIVYGTATALTGVVITVAVAALIAIPLGLASTLFRRFGAVITRANDLILSIPGIVVLLMVLALTGSLNGAMAALGILFAPGLLRVVRGAALAIVEEPYVAAARVFGVGKWKIAFRHVLPRALGPILVNLSIIAANGLIIETGLNYLGLGLQPPTPSWGGLVADGANAIEQQPWTLIPTGGIVAITVVAFVLLGDAIRDVTTESWAAGRTKGARLSKAARRATLEKPVASSAPLAGALLSVRDLSIAFPTSSGGEVTVVQSVSFDVGRGEAVGLVGESGCGKTITGLGVLGLLPAGARITSGQIVVDGQDVVSLTARERSALRGTTIAFISQEPMMALDPLFTVGSQLREAIRTHTTMTRKQARARAIDLLERVRINEPERVANSYPHQISGGMAQRVAIAIALAGEPKILIADEPTTALDVTVQKEILELLQTIQKDSGMGLLLISHDWGVVSALCPRSVVMYAGQVVEQASVDAIIESPRHPYSAGLLAANPHFTAPGERLATIPGSVPPPASWPVSCHFADRCPMAIDACRAGAIPMVQIGADRESRCIRTDEMTEDFAQGFVA